MIDSDKVLVIELIKETISPGCSRLGEVDAVGRVDALGCVGSAENFRFRSTAAATIRPVARSQRSILRSETFPLLFHFSFSRSLLPYHEAYP